MNDDVIGKFEHRPAAVMLQREWLRFRIDLRSIFLGLVVFTAMPSLLFADGASSFNQTNWGGGNTDSPALAPANSTGWNKWKLKDNLLSAVNGGADLLAVGPIISILHTLDSDFAFAQDFVTRTSDADFTTTVSGVTPVLTNVVVSGGSIRLASGQVSGTYTSTLIDTYLPDAHYGLKNVLFSATVPSGTTISADGDPGQFTATIYLRAGNTTPPDGTWTAWQELANGFTIGSFLERRYVQYEARFATNNAAVSPTLDDVTVGYVNFPSGTGVEVTGGSVGLKAGFSSGTYLSKILDLTKARELTTLDFDRTTPSSSNVHIFVRAGSQPSPTASPGSWTAWTQIFAASPASLASLGVKRYFQYKTEIVAPLGGAPTLNSLQVNYRDDPDNTERPLQSSRFDTNNAASHIDAVYWTEDSSLPAGANVKMRLATATTPGGIDDSSFVGPGFDSAKFWDSANTHGGGCFKRGIWVACTSMPTQLQQGGDDQTLAYKVTLAPNSGNSPIVSDVIVRHGTGNPHAVTVIPTSGIVLSEADTVTTVNVGAVLHTQPTSPVIINFTSSDPAEVKVNGGTTAQLTFTNANWNTPQDIALTAVDDSVADGNKVVTIVTAIDAGSDANYIGVDVADITVTNNDDDKYIATIIATDENAAELGRDPGTFTISLNGVATANTDISFSVTGTANHAGSDYAPLLASPATVIIGNQTVTMTITPVDDNLLEGDETVTVTLLPGTGYAAGTPGSATVTIFDDEVPLVPTVTVTASSVNARESDGTQGFFTVSRTGLKTNPLAVFFSVGGTATPVSDYTAISGSSVIIPAGSSNVVIAIKPVNDSAVEGDETVTLTLTSQSGYLIGSSGSATVTIIDDDAAPAPSGGGGGGGGAFDWLLALLVGIFGVYRARREMFVH
ncbi:MAG: putative extracellular nuclease [Gammaproteobacteria bacterium]|nr:MAG: putative extracellular nuclease [Gammaproteobacteria bacterium]TND07006.1 MAG: putative extracellular nuclease [Gammaproteobacteria bacterium]